MIAIFLLPSYVIDPDAYRVDWGLCIHLSMRHGRSIRETFKGETRGLHLHNDATSPGRSRDIATISQYWSLHLPALITLCDNIKNWLR